ncbi:hypothetical protein C8Q74DRAFT_331566 [Fomes fomentarius]|nr:hypothetical protein C8Q74DRAFT_331566 [Fomes fomentarius]
MLSPLFPLYPPVETTNPDLTRPKPSLHLYILWAVGRRTAFTRFKLILYSHFTGDAYVLVAHHVRYRRDNFDMFLSAVEVLRLWYFHSRPSTIHNTRSNSSYERQACVSVNSSRQHPTLSRSAGSTGWQALAKFWTCGQTYAILFALMGGILSDRAGMRVCARGRRCESPVVGTQGELGAVRGERRKGSGSVEPVAASECRK